MIQKLVDRIYNKFFYRLIENHCEELFLTLFYRETMQNTETKLVHDRIMDEIQREAIENLKKRKV